ncbi:hypothetical protein ACFL56_02895 [Candidatus Margulisiibacteriota bacterium]
MAKKKRKKVAKKAAPKAVAKGGFQINWGKYLLASIVAVVIIFISDFIVHSKLLMDLYAQNARLFLPMAIMKERQIYMYAGQILFGLFFVLLYTQGYSGKKPTIVEGLRYGLYLGLLMAIPFSLMMYGYSKYPVELLKYWGLAEFVRILIMGGFTGAIYSHK